MIFVTVGTIHFDALVRRTDEIVGAGFVRDEVILQIGYGGRYLPRHCRYIRSAPTLEPFERAADLVIGHGGTATTVEVLQMGKPLISVSNPALSDNHQHEFLEALEAIGLVTYCRNVEDLPKLIAAPPPGAALTTPRSKLAAELAMQIDRLERRRRVRRPVLERAVSLLLRGMELDVSGVLRPALPPALPTSLLIDPVAHA